MSGVVAKGKGLEATLEAAALGEDFVRQLPFPEVTEAERKEQEERKRAKAAAEAAAEAAAKERGEAHLGSGDYYWNSYAHFGIHEEMLKDDVRTRSYRNAIIQNRQLIEGKVVLDVGCGTGIMSLFAAQTGAKHVYAIDNSGILEQAKQIVADNGYSDKITLIRGKVEEVELPVDKVDVIISEWMGYFLFYESMLDTVIYARDKWLNEGGCLLPDVCNLSIVGIEDEEYKEEKIAWWDKVWGFDMSCIGKLSMLEPLVDVVEERAIVTDHCEMLRVDLMTVTKEELAFEVPFKLKALRNDHCHAFVVYFDIWFQCCHKPIHFSTGPHARYTHWKQTVFYLDEVLMVTEGDEVRGILACRPNAKNPRDLDISVQYKFKGKYNDEIGRAHV